MSIEAVALCYMYIFLPEVCTEHNAECHIQLPGGGGGGGGGGAVELKNIFSQWVIKVNQ